MRVVLLLVCGLVVAFGQAKAEESHKVAVYPCELYDTSGGGDAIEKKADRQRVKLVSDALKEGLAKKPFYEVVDTSKANEVDSVNAWFAADGLFRECNGCEAEISRLLGADLSFACVVQKVSNLILSINVYMRESNSEQLVATYSSSIRGNTDYNWLRSVRWLMKNRLNKPPKLPETP